MDYHAVCQIFSRYCNLFFDGSPQVKCSQLSCCCRCSQFVKFSHCTQRVVSSQVLIFAHLTQRLVSSQFLIFLIWLSVWEAQGFSCFLIFSHFISFYLIFSHFIPFFLILSHLFSWGVALFSIAVGWVFSFFLILSHFFSFHLIFSHFISFFLISSHFVSFLMKKMHLDASCRRLQSLFKPSLLHWQKMSNVVEMRRESRAANRARMNAAGVNPMIILLVRWWAWSLSCQIRNTWLQIKTASKNVLYLTIACWRWNTIQHVILRFAHEIWVMLQRFSSVGRQQIK